MICLHVISGIAKAWQPVCLASSHTTRGPAIYDSYSYHQDMYTKTKGGRKHYYGEPTI